MLLLPTDLSCCCVSRDRAGLLFGDKAYRASAAGADVRALEQLVRDWGWRFQDPRRTAESLTYVRVRAQLRRPPWHT